MKHWNYIKDHPRLIQQLRYAKLTGKLLFSPQSSEIQEEDKDNYVPYRAGFYAEDVNGFWVPDSYKIYFKANYENFMEAWEEFGFFAAFKFLNFALPWSGWCWVIDAKSTIKHDIAMEAYRKNNRKTNTSYDDLVAAVTAEQVNEHLKANYTQLSEGLWVSESDVSCMIYDEDLKPFALEHGWSKEQMGEILEHWYEILVGEKIKAEFRLESNW